MSNNDCLEESALKQRRVPCLIAFLHPFRIVNAPESPEWTVSLDRINRGTWDYVALHEIVGGIDVGLESPYHMVVCRDGGLALPPVLDLRGDQAAVEFFNRCLASILLGGIYCEAITLDGLDFGFVFDWKYVRITTCSVAAANRFHFIIRGQNPSALDAIALDEPRTILMDDLVRAGQKGRRVLEGVPAVRGEFLLKGVTGFARRDWGAALANLWIVVEQVTTHLWNSKVIDTVREPPVIPGRVDNLRDNRTWPVATQHEMLFQIRRFDAGLYELLSVARKARNRLAHSGSHPGEDDATGALLSVKKLLGIALPDLGIPFVDTDLGDHAMSHPFGPREQQSLSPKYWMEMKNLPREAEVEKLEAEARRG